MDNVLLLSNLRCGSNSAEITFMGGGGGGGGLVSSDVTGMTSHRKWSIGSCCSARHSEINRGLNYAKITGP